MSGVRIFVKPPGLTANNPTAATPKPALRSRILEAPKEAPFERIPNRSGFDLSSVPAYGPEGPREHPMVVARRQLLRVHQTMQAKLQAKLQADAVNDPLEHEADRVADAVVSGNHVALPTTTATAQAAQRKCTACEEDEKVDGALQRKAVGDANVQAPAAVDHVLRSSGRSLDASTREFMESRFGQDFSDVRIHDDTNAQQSAHAVRARAYTVGGDVVFGAGQYQPESTEGRRLLAHELTHVVQQGVGERRIQRAPLGEVWSEYVSKPYQSGKEKVYSSLIDAYEGYRRGVIAAMRRTASQLSGRSRGAALEVVGILDAATKVTTTLAYAEVGILVGAGEGFVDLIEGIISLLYNVCDLVVRFFYGFIDHGQAFDERANEIVGALKGLPDALDHLVTDWLARFSAAPTARKSIMVGELIGQIIALIATFEVAAGKAGQIPRLTLPTIVTQGNSLALATAAADVGPAAAAGVRVGGAALLTTGGAGGKDASRQGAPELGVENATPEKASTKGETRTDQAQKAAEGVETIAGRLLGSNNGSVTRSLQELSAMKLGQDKAIEVLQQMYKASGRGTGGLSTLADGAKALLSRRIGPNQAILVIDVEGAVRTATATIELSGDLTNPLRAVDILF
ncbi:DUF4157 domain-containing protein [Pendulispora rubella]|uniref:DUF4157 domain-containing protein n=1 Tax=Pendulispora rubella TaxID=2741070 RepID=A0ABZ2L1J0_9BACT